jgi:hypothetical protein
MKLPVLGAVAEGFGESAFELVAVTVCQTKSRSEAP